MVNKLLGIVIIYMLLKSGYGYRYHKKPKLDQVFAWNQIGYSFDGVCYINNTDFENDDNGDVTRSGDAIKDSDRFFIPYNNVPIGFEVYGHRVFITVPRRRYGIPSTLNYVDYHSGQSHSLSPLLKPYPDVARSKELISVYRPRVDECGRLWMVDTGLMEIPDDRKQIQPPSIIVFDLKTDQKILKYQLKPTDLVNERSSAGLTSITVDASANSCDDAYAYINDLATNGIIVFSMRDRDSWRVQHGSFSHEEAAMNFSVAGNVITWRDGVFSIALTEPGSNRSRKAYYHALVSTKEFSVDTDVLKTKGASLEGHVKEEGNRGPLTQSGSHAYHAATRTILFANVARDAILCWQVDTEMTAETVPIVVQDRRKLVYISDLKIVGDDVWVLVNQIPRIIYSTLNTDETNFYIHKGKIQDLIRGTACDRVKNN